MDKVHGLADVLGVFTTRTATSPQPNVVSARADAAIANHVITVGNLATTSSYYISEYRDCLERLRDVLSLLQTQLLAQRSRLEPEREHVQAAAAWAQCAKGLLK